MEDMTRQHILTLNFDYLLFIVIWQSIFPSSQDSCMEKKNGRHGRNLLLVFSFDTYSSKTEEADKPSCQAFHQTQRLQNINTFRKTQVS